MNSPLRRHAIHCAAILLVGFGLLGCEQPLDIDILSPSHGGFTTASEVEVTGVVRLGGRNAAGVVVTVNAAPVPVASDGRWSALVPVDSVRVFNPVLAEVRETATGAVARERIVLHAGLSVPSDARIVQGMGLRLDETGLAKLEPAVEILLASDLDLDALIRSRNPFSYCALRDPFTQSCLVPLAVYIDRVETADIRIHANPNPGSLNVALVLNELSMDFSVPAIGCGGRIGADSTTISGNFALSPLAQDPEFVDVNQLGSLSVGATGFANDFTSGVCDLFQPLLDLFVGDVQQEMFSSFQQKMSDPDGAGPEDAPMAQAFQVALGGLNLAGPISGELGITLDATFFSIQEEDAGITFAVDAGFRAVEGTGPGQCLPPVGAPALVETFYVPEPFPVFAATTPVGGLRYDMGFAISTVDFNQLLTAMTRCGELHRTLTEISFGAGSIPLTTGLLGLFDPAFARFAPMTRLHMEIVPTLAPILTGRSGPDGEIGELRIAQLLLRVVFTDSGALAVEVAMDAVAGLDLGFSSGRLDFAFATDPSLVTATVLRNPVGVDKVALETNVLPALFAQLLPEMADTLGSFPFPTFLGLELQPVEISRLGPFTAIFGDLATPALIGDVLQGRIAFLDQVLLEGSTQVSDPSLVPELQVTHALGGGLAVVVSVEMTASSVTLRLENVSPVTLHTLGSDGRSYTIDLTDIDAVGIVGVRSDETRSTMGLAEAFTTPTSIHATLPQITLQPGERVEHVLRIETQP